MFEQEGIVDFTRLPSEIIVRKKFVDLFKTFNEYLEAAKVQGFVWKKTVYEFEDADSGEKFQVQVALNEVTYKVLAQRYKELFAPGDGAGSGEDVPYDIDGYLIAIDTEKIDVDYMNSKFEKFLKLLHQ